MLYIFHMCCSQLHIWPHMYVINIHCIYLKNIIQQNSFCFQRGHSKFGIIVLKQNFVFYLQLSPRSGLGLYVEINALGLMCKVTGMELYTPIVFLFTMICNIGSTRVILLDCIPFYLFTILYEMKIDLGGGGKGGDAFATRLCIRAWGALPILPRPAQEGVPEVPKRRLNV